MEKLGNIGHLKNDQSDLLGKLLTLVREMEFLSTPLCLTGVLVGDTRAPKLDIEDPGLSSITEPGLLIIIAARDIARGSSI